MPYKRGDVVLVRFPFSSGKAVKRPPVLIVQCDRNNARLANVIVAMISTNTSLANVEPTQRLIDINTPEGRQTGLISTSQSNAKIFSLLSNL